MYKNKKPLLFTLVFLCVCAALWLSINMHTKQKLLQKSDNIELIQLTNSIKKEEIFFTESVEEITKKESIEEESTEEAVGDEGPDGLEIVSALPLAGEEAYNMLMSACGEIDFYGEFQMGDRSLYHAYLENYIQLFQGQRNVYCMETKTEISIGELDLAEAEDGESGFGHKYYRYLYFDADGDEKPEMVLTDAGMCYVFKYIAESDKIVLLYATPYPTYEYVYGSRRMYFLNLREPGIIEVRLMNQYFQKERYVIFISAVTYTGENAEKTKVYAVSLPAYYNSEKQTAYVSDMMTEKMKEGAYENGETWIFHVTKEQFEELTDTFFQSFNTEDTRRDKVEYTYEELLDGVKGGAL